MVQQRSKLPAPSTPLAARAIAARKLPLWAQRLDRTVADLRHVQWPATPEEGLRQSLALASLGWRQILDSLRQAHPEASEQEIADQAYRMICGWQRRRDRLTFPRG